MNKNIVRWIVLAAAIVAFIILISNQSWWEAMLRFFFPQQQDVIYPVTSLLVLVGQHIKIVAISSLLTIILGVSLALWVSHASGADFLPLVGDITALGQTIPPVAVLALAVPLLGFGTYPVILALFLYGLLPVVRNTIVGINALPRAVIDVARGMGMSGRQILVQVELPLAGSVIIAGIRTSVVINVGTATIGAVIGAGGLGSPIIAGLVLFNTAYIIEGAIPAALLAILLDQFFAAVEKTFTYQY
jgi:osmoprotectant transport system permease protein